MINIEPSIIARFLYMFNIYCKILAYKTCYIRYFMNIVEILGFK